MNEHTKIRVVNFFLDFLLSFFFYFIKRKKNRIIFMSSYLGDYTSNSKFLFEDLINQDIGYELKFVVNDEHLRTSLEERLGKHFISNKTLKEKIYILNAKYWVCSYFDMPVQGIFLSFRRIVLHLGHGIPVKSSGLLEENISKLKKIYYYLNKYNITYHYAPTSFVSNILSRMFGCKKNKFVIASQPRTDYLSSLDLNYSNNRNSKFNVLYAPTWRNNSRNFFEMFKLEEIKKFKDKLDKIGVSFTYRPHPLFDFPDEIKNTLNISTKECEPEICDFLSSYDLLVTDYSSISIDYLILDRPIIIFNYDYDIYSIDNGFCFDFEEYNPGDKVKDLDELYQSIFNNIKDKDKFKDNRRTLHNLINGEHKNSSEIFIRDILNDK